jgi:hypothetical protein
MVAEACLCGALSSPPGPARARALATRPAFEAKDLLGKPRPEVRVVDASSNLHAEDDWHSLQREDKGKKTYSSVRRLTVDNVDALRPALTRCGIAGDTTLVAELWVSEAGVVQSARVVTGMKNKRDGACVEKALVSGAFSCTNDGKPATVFGDQLPK